MLFINDIQFDCINTAAVKYHIPAIVILAVLKTENGRQGTANSNLNGTIDYGAMQINSVFLSRLSSDGYSVKDLQYNGCTNIYIGVWILSQQIANSTNFAVGIGNYHSHTLKLNKHYFNKVQKNYEKITKILY